MLRLSQNVNKTSKFAVIDFADLQVNHIHTQAEEKKENVGAGAGDRKGIQTRSNEAHGPRMEDGKIGGAFVLTSHPRFVQSRAEIFERIWLNFQQDLASKPKVPITITLPDGSVKDGTSFVTTPMDIVSAISSSLANSTVIASVTYTARRLDEDESNLTTACDDDEEMKLPSSSSSSSSILWDMTRPLVGNCQLKLVKFNEPEGKMVFWHSSAHILGAALESVYGAHLTIGPPLEAGFYYDCYMGGNNSVHEEEFKQIEQAATSGFIEKKFPFQRCVLSKESALELFADNPFKVKLITNKVPDGGKTTVYKCGPFIDLCMGPHVSNTRMIKALAVTRNSGSYWLGNTANDQLQRVYGIAFPTAQELATYLQQQEEAKARDHRRLGLQQDLFYFDDLSPGSAFWLPHGTRIYNKLVDWMRSQYRIRGYTEVITPNIFNLDLWRISGHADHYKANMFTFDIEGKEWGMKPMNCPGHCLMFDHTSRSYKDLPIRLADFGVLHRNEFSGALTGLTRVRRFQQDDAHIFCRVDQIKQEVLGALDFVAYVYRTLGMTFTLELSTRPEKALGEDALWVMAEASLAEALNEFVGENGWRTNPGDGAFYGPKIDIKVRDALDRLHQCATVQLDFQLPIRFKLKYKEADVFVNNAAVATTTGADDGNEVPPGFKRPVMVHRAMLGSLERMSAVLLEHYGGKWPFWLSPRQVLVVPVSGTHEGYANEVGKAIFDAGFYVDVDGRNETMNKKIREGQLAQYNFILVVGAKEVAARTVNVRTRNNDVLGEKTIEECISWFQEINKNFQ